MVRLCNTRKNTDFYASDSLLVAVTSMQGWRDEMEDAYCVLLPKESAIDRHVLGTRKWRDEHRTAVLDQYLDVTLEQQSIQQSQQLQQQGSLAGVAPFPTPSSSAPVFFSQGHGSVRMGTSVDVGSLHNKHHAPSVNCSIGVGPSRATRATICGVFDGHGGASVAEAVAQDMADWICKSSNFTNHFYERALHDAFVTNDEKLHAQWTKSHHEFYGFAGCTANVVMIVEDFSSEITRKLEQRRLAVGGPSDNSFAASSKCPLGGGQTPPSGSPLGHSVNNNAPFSLTSPPGEGGGVQNSSFAFGASVNAGAGFLGGLSESAVLGSSPAYSPAPATQAPVACDEVRIICANAGDARALMVRVNGLVVPLSTDHKPSSSSEKGRITAAHGFVSKEKNGCDRIDGILAVSRGFGDFMFKGDKSLAADKQLVIPNPDVRTTHQKKDFKGRYAFPWVEFGSSHVFSDAIVRRINDGKALKDKRHHRTPAERELLHLQKCLQWVPAQQRPAGPSPDAILGGVTVAPGTPQAGGGGDNSYSRPPSPQAGLRRAGSAQCLDDILNSTVNHSAMTCNGRFADAADDDHCVPPAFDLCDPSAMSSSLFVAQGCDGIWDCVSNKTLGEMVMNLLDEQLVCLLEKSRRARRKANGGATTTVSPAVSSSRRTSVQSGGVSAEMSPDAFCSSESDDDDAESDQDNGGPHHDHVAHPFGTEAYDRHVERRAEPFRKIASTIETKLITEAIVQHCLEHSFSAPANCSSNQPKPHATSPTTTDSPSKSFPTSSHTNSPTCPHPSVLGVGTPPPSLATFSAVGTGAGVTPASFATTSTSLDMFGISPALTKDSVEKALASASKVYASGDIGGEVSGPFGQTVASGHTTPLVRSPTCVVPPTFPQTNNTNGGGAVGRTASGQQSVGNGSMVRCPSEASISRRGATTAPQYTTADYIREPALATALPLNTKAPMPTPKKPGFVNGTDNMTFALIFFKDGVTARAMYLDAQMRTVRRMARAGRAAAKRAQQQQRAGSPFGSALRSGGGGSTHDLASGASVNELAT